MLKHANYWANDLVIEDYTRQPQDSEWFCRKYRPPYIITSMDLLHETDTWLKCKVLTPESPIPIDAWCTRGVSNLKTEYQAYDLYLQPIENPDVSYTIDPKDVTNILAYYDRLMKEQVTEIISSLDWNKVKQEQQSQFIMGLRLMRFHPEVALQICFDSYNFDEFEFNYLNPASYLSVISTITGIAKAIV